jgi:hypothetical protein
MRRDIQTGRHTATSLRGMLEKSLAETYGVSRDTARKAVVPENPIQADSRNEAESAHHST